MFSLQPWFSNFIGSLITWPLSRVHPLWVSKQHCGSGFRHHQQVDLTEITPSVQTVRAVTGCIFSGAKEFRPYFIKWLHYQSKQGLDETETAAAAHLHIHWSGRFDYESIILLIYSPFKPTELSCTAPGCMAVIFPWAGTPLMVSPQI